MNDVVNKDGEGWVAYKWPKPGIGRGCRQGILRSDRDG